MFASNFLLQAIHFRREEFDGTAAFGAYHVMMAPAIVLMLIASDSVMKRDFTGQPAFGQELERAINGGKSDFGILFLDQAVQFVSGKVFASFQKGSQNRIALFRMLQADTFQMAMQDRLRLANHLSRDAGLVVNSFLQHALCRSQAAGSENARRPHQP